MDRTMIGKRNKATGEIFERLVSASCNYYREQGLAFIEKTPEPMKPLGKMNQKGQFTAVFTKQAQPDFKGVLLGGQAVIFEAKHTDGDRIEKSRLTDTQERTLNAYYFLGAKCFILVSFRFEQFCKIPWVVWQDMKNIFGRQYITEEDAEQFSVVEERNILYFLEKDSGHDLIIQKIQ